MESYQTDSMRQYCQALKIYPDEIIHTCQHMTTSEEIFKFVEEYSSKSSRFFYKDIYNDLVGWALPSRQACNLIVQAWQEHIKIYPQACLVDYGAGSGVFTYVFSLLGIPKEKLIAVDLPTPSHATDQCRQFWPITRHSNYIVEPKDILFIAWGSCTNDVIESYEQRGGTCIIILGEREGGCTLPADYFGNSDYWYNIYHEVPAAASYSPELLSINIRV